MRRLERGAGRKVGAGDTALNPAAGARQFRASDWGGARGRGSHPGGGGVPPGDTTIPRQELADRRKCRKARPDAVVRTPQQSAERRARARVMGLGDLRRSGDRLDREASHRVRRIRTSACRRSAPLFFKGAEKDKGLPRPPVEAGGGAMPCHSGSEPTGPRKARPDDRLREEAGIHNPERNR